jgi:hypothetical protein
VPAGIKIPGMRGRPKYPKLASYVLGTALLSAVSGCSSASPSEPSSALPQWLQSMIAQIESEPVTNPPSAIYRYRYQGASVYFRPERCCDLPSELYDEAGQLLCHPSGGITGRGDGRCPDFFNSRGDERVVWQDPRR